MSQNLMNEIELKLAMRDGAMVSGLDGRNALPLPHSELEIQGKAIGDTEDTLHITYIRDGRQQTTANSVKSIHYTRQGYHVI